MPAVPRAHPAAEALAEGFGPDLFLSDPDLVAPLTRDRTGAYVGEPVAVARPRSTAELADLVRRCRSLGLGIVPQGGLTGLVGAAVSGDVEREVVVLLDRMDRVRLVDPIGFALVVEAGCVLETAKQAAAAEDLLLPITFGAQGSARIGGVVATNAGGFNVLRYGMTRDLVLGLEVVLPDGRIWDGLRTLRKDNRGYDLKQLFLGAEGTLGIVTAAAFKLFPKPTRVETALVGLRSVADALALYAKARRACSDLLSAFRAYDARWPRARARRPARPRRPARRALPRLRADGTRGERPRGPRGAARRAVRGRGRPHRRRHHRPEPRPGGSVVAAARSHGGGPEPLGPLLPHRRVGAVAGDPGLPGAAFARLAADLPDGRPIAYGHIGDGNIHLNVVPPAVWPVERRRDLFRAAEDLIFKTLDRFGGSISAEHGIGRSKKRAFLERVDPVTLDLLRRVKSAIDPDGLMSRGRIFDP